MVSFFSVEDASNHFGNVNAPFDSRHLETCEAVQLGQDLDGEAAGDWFGYSVALSSDGDILAVGGYRNDGNGDNAGHARVFHWNGNAWAQRGNDLDGEAAGDEFGRSVALSSDGHILAVGGFFNDGNGVNAGHARVFHWNGNAWAQRGNDLDGEAAGDEFGRSVALSSDGHILAVGGFFNDGNGVNAGHARVFSYQHCTDEGSNLNWNINKPEVTANKNDNELSVVYQLVVPADANKTKVDANTQLYKKGCFNKIGLDSPINFVNENNNSTSLSFDIDINQTSIFADDRFISSGKDDTATIAFCLRTDLSYQINDEFVSITFREDDINVAVNLTTGFNFTSIVMKKAEKVVSNTTADVETTVYAFHADSACVEANAPSKVEQGQEVYICIENESAGLDLVSVKDMKCSNDGLTFTIVEDGNRIVGVSSVESLSDDRIKVSTILVSGFFDKEDSDVTCSGEVVLKVQEATEERRLLEDNIFVDAEEVVEEDVETFMVRFKLAEAKETVDGSNEMSGAVEGGVSQVVMAVFGIMTMLMW